MILAVMLCAIGMGQASSGPEQPKSASTTAADSAAAQAPAASAPESNRLAAWLGRWAGPATVSTGEGVRQSFAMELNIGPTDNPARLTWEIVYITPAAAGQPERRQVRPYELVTLDADRGRYHVDEKNGIILPTTLINGVLHACFIVQGNQISVSYRLLDASSADERRLVIEMITTDTTRPSTTGDQDSVPPVITLPTRSVQRAELSPQK